MLELLAEWLSSSYWPPHLIIPLGILSAILPDLLHGGWKELKNVWLWLGPVPICIIIVSIIGHFIAPVP